MVSPTATQTQPSVVSLSSTAVTQRHIASEMLSDQAVTLSRGDDFLARGDVSAARLLDVHAANLGSAHAATAAGKTYDPAFLASIHAIGIRPDRAAANAWYRKAAALGDAEGAKRLANPN